MILFRDPGDFFLPTFDLWKDLVRVKLVVTFSCLYKAFPADFSVVKFNPTPKSLLFKALKAFNANKSLHEKIASLSNGDLRNCMLICFMLGRSNEICSMNRDFESSVFDELDGLLLGKKTFIPLQVPVVYIHEHYLDALSDLECCATVAESISYSNVNWKDNSAQILEESLWTMTSYEMQMNSTARQIMYRSPKLFEWTHKINQNFEKMKDFKSQSHLLDYRVALDYFMAHRRGMLAVDDK